jgi:hypothetical protein
MYGLTAKKLEKSNDTVPVTQPKILGQRLSISRPSFTFNFFFHAASLHPQICSIFVKNNNRCFSEPFSTLYPFSGETLI